MSRREQLPFRFCTYMWSKKSLEESFPGIISILQSMCIRNWTALEDTDEKSGNPANEDCEYFLIEFYDERGAWSNLGCSMLYDDLYGLLDYEQLDNLIVWLRRNWIHYQEARWNVTST